MPDFRSGGRLLCSEILSFGRKIPDHPIAVPERGIYDHPSSCKSPLDFDKVCSRAYGGFIAIHPVFVKFYTESPCATRKIICLAWQMRLPAKNISMHKTSSPFC
jgi:hypothetical protein